jgi:hypothetical protein
MVRRVPSALAGAALSILVLGACSIAPNSDPRVTAIEPAFGYEGETTEVTLTGEGFSLRASRDVSCGGAPLVVDDGFEGELGDAVLEEVVWVDARTLTARVPGTLAVGFHDLVVVAPSGDTVELVDAFEVRSPAGDSDSDSGLDSDTDGDTDTDSDADTDTDPDTDIDTDTGSDSDTGSDAETEVECGDGALLWGLCWYLGAGGQSCLEVCALHGGYAEETSDHVGVPAQGGSLAECNEIFTALGYFYGTVEGTRDDGLGLGCHRWGGDVLWWLTDPPFDPAHSVLEAERVCGCLGVGG